MSALTRENSIRAARKRKTEVVRTPELAVPREHQIFDRLVPGKVSKEIAYELGISERTVKGPFRPDGEARRRLNSRPRPAGRAIAPRARRDKPF